MKNTAHREQQPDGDDHPGGDPTHRLPRPHQPSRLLAALVEDGGRDQPDHQRHPERDEDQVVQIADDGDRVGDQIDRAERIGQPRQP